MIKISQTARRSAMGWMTGFNPRWRRSGDFSKFLRVQTDPEVHSASLKMSIGAFPVKKIRPRVGLATVPFPSAMATNK